METPIHKSAIVRAIALIQQEVSRFQISLDPSHAAEIALAWENGYYVRWNPKHYVRPYLPEPNDDAIVICTGNPKPNPGPFRLACNDLELTHSHLTRVLNEKIRNAFQEMTHTGL